MVFKKSTLSIEDRFWSKVDKSGGPDACWEWMAGRSGSGYGAFQISTHKQVKPHRLSYEMCVGPIPAGMDILHHCDNRLCVNPRHLFPGTDLDNARDRSRKGRNNTPAGDRHPSHRHPELIRRGEETSNARLTREQVIEIRRRYLAGGITHLALGREYGISAIHVGQLVRRERWAHVLEPL